MKHYLPVIFTFCFALLLSLAATAQDRTVTGTVSDKSDGVTMPGVTIRIKNNSGGGSTTADGTFSIRVP
ncbi:MAG: carboxypeptidase-like regulatory domain-containing protein [Saprospiraceae bacterium]|nr:carboxypeptidase-like regulatory domain-containing protein [Saprospiraceae bacterium]